MRLVHVVSAYELKYLLRELLQPLGATPAFGRLLLLALCCIGGIKLVKSSGRVCVQWDVDTPTFGRGYAMHECMPRNQVSVRGQCSLQGVTAYFA